MLSQYQQPAYLCSFMVDFFYRIDRAWDPTIYLNIRDVVSINPYSMAVVAVRVISRGAHSNFNASDVVS